MAEYKNQVIIAEILVSKGEEIFKQSHESIILTKNEEANEYLRNIEEFPHAFVLACIMDRRIKFSGEIIKISHGYGLNIQLKLICKTHTRQ